MALSPSEQRSGIGGSCDSAYVVKNNGMSANLTESQEDNSWLKKSPTCAHMNMQTLATSK